VTLNLAKGTMDASSKDHRMEQYQVFTAKIRLLNLHTKVETEGIVTELSAIGCFVLTKKPLPERTPIWVKLKSNDVEFNCAAQVMGNSRSAGMHLLFINPAPEQQSILRQWMQSSASARMHAR
jgi:PilZ domain